MKLKAEIENLKVQKNKIDEEINGILRGIEGVSVINLNNKDEYKKKIKKEIEKVKKDIKKEETNLKKLEKEKKLNKVLSKGKVLIVIYKFVVLPLTILFIAMRILGKEELVHSVFGIIPAVLYIFGLREIDENTLKLILLIEAYLTDLLIVLVFYIPTIYLFRKFRVPAFYKALAILMWLIPILFIFSIAWNLNR